MYLPILQLLAINSPQSSRTQRNCRCHQAVDLELRRDDTLRYLRSMYIAYDKGGGGQLRSVAAHCFTLPPCRVLLQPQHSTLFSSTAVVVVAGFNVFPGPLCGTPSSLYKTELDGDLQNSKFHLGCCPPLTSLFRAKTKTHAEVLSSSFLSSPLACRNRMSTTW